MLTIDVRFAFTWLRFAYAGSGAGGVPRRRSGRAPSSRDGALSPSQFIYTMSIMYMVYSPRLGRLTRVADWAAL